MKLYFHNTLNKKKEEFIPIRKGEVSMYNCGPTVYNYAHIGNLRAYVFVDILRRSLELNDFKINQVMNITDVGHLSSDADEGEDKMTKALKREGKPMTLEAMKEVGNFYTNAFIEDLKSLNIKLPDKMPRASEHIEEDIELIKKLIDKSFAYKTSDGIYFDTSKFKDYGKLGKINLEGQKEGARVAANKEKKNAHDFNLWKLNQELGFESSFGKGFPGWHIECSAMSKKYLGQPFDIHTGGVDHIGTHHNNEIAQSEAAEEVLLANYWLHNEHLNIADGKMAKSAGNFLTLQSLCDGNYNSMHYRYYLLGGHYRTPMIFSWEALEGAKNSLDRLVKILAKMPEKGEINESYIEKFKGEINNDLNTAGAIAVLWELVQNSEVKEGNRLATALKFDETLGLNIKELISLQTKPLEIPTDVSSLIKEREMARKNKDWKKSDDLREEIKKFGFEVKDTDDGQKLEKNK